MEVRQTNILKSNRTDTIEYPDDFVVLRKLENRRLNIVKEIAYCFQESSEAISLTMFSLTKARPVAWSGFSPRLKKPQKKRISQKTSKKRTKTGKKTDFLF